MHVETPDAQLIARLRNRDRDLITSLVTEFSMQLYRAARGMGFREEEAEDAVQDVFATFLSTLDRFEGRSKLRTWLFGILHNKALERHRQHGHDIQQESIDDVLESRFNPDGTWAVPLPSLPRLLESKEIGAAISHCLERLPQLQRSVFVLREMEDLDTNEICKILGVTVTNIGVLMYRAKNRLRQCMEGRGWGRPE